MTDLLMTQELFLLTHDDRTGKSTAVSLSPEAALAGALLLDLAEAGAIAVDENKKVSTLTEPERNLLLKEAYTVIASAEKQKSVVQWISRLPSRVGKLSDKVGESLVDLGVLDKDRGSMLGLFHRTCWPETDPSAERGLCERLDEILVHGAAATRHEQWLIVLLVGQRLVADVVAPEDLDTAMARAMEIVHAAKAEHSVAAIVAHAVHSTQAAATAAGLPT